MRPALRCTTIVAILALAGACAPSAPEADPRPSPEEMIAAATALDSQYLDAFNREDADALMATYWHSPRLVSIGLDGSAPQGWEGASAAWHESMDGNPDSRLEFVESHNVPLGEAVIGWGRWRLTTPSDSGPPEVLEGPYSDVKAFRDGRWVRVLDHASVPMP
ncbi:MAG TPA: nuclear transport factor 2 family protein [Gemmatimonadales bacterium]|nr:nuclear transport factor 2 family protein [Gemmatimonadales bacterium]